MSDSLPSRSVIAGLKPPSRLSLGSNIQESWKLFKQRWDTYSVLSQISTLSGDVQVALFLHCLDDDALKAYSGFSFEQPESLSDIITKFESFAIGELARNLKLSSTSLTSFGGSTLSSRWQKTGNLKNAKTGKKFNVVCEQDVQPILGLRAAEQMNLLYLQNENFEEVCSLSSIESFFVFNDELGYFPGVQHLTKDPEVKPVIMPNRRVPVAVKDRLKQETWIDLPNLVSSLLLQSLPPG
ncbi:hypothetical protein EGW08_014503 [Elysia chlorotica]|uniref:Uncharacterized protein n=1 Tax=Elysia chlorotica TaxID=188477 RepID=A0A433T8C7_ELYCH|nr:hypothetical protein EGW08_014503 [Elysia chlorotica]